MLHHPFRLVTDEPPRQPIYRSTGLPDDAPADAAQFMAETATYCDPVEYLQGMYSLSDGEIDSVADELAEWLTDADGPVTADQQHQLESVAPCPAA